MDKIISLLVSTLVAVFIIWWFFGKRKSATVAATRIGGRQRVEITVDGGYQPQVVQLEAGVPAQLVFHRKDPSSCLEEVLLPDFGVAKALPVGESTTIEVKPDKPGQYKYTCGMQMFSGQVVVK